MPDICPIIVYIGKRLNGHADHPNWDLVDLSDITDEPIQNNGRHADDYVADSWLYDKCCGHDDNVPGVSPLGMRWGVRLVTPGFARAAANQFPNRIFPMTEQELNDFYEEHVMGHMPEEDIDTEALAGLNAELQLAIVLEDDELIDALKVRARKALDPNDRERGATTNPRRHWSQMKAIVEANIVPLPPQFAGKEDLPEPGIRNITGRQNNRPLGEADEADEADAPGRRG